MSSMNTNELMKIIMKTWVQKIYEDCGALVKKKVMRRNSKWP